MRSITKTARRHASICIALVMNYCHICETVKRFCEKFHEFKQVAENTLKLFASLALRMLVKCQISQRSRRFSDQGSPAVTQL